jgi:hypothetical protein
MSGGRRSRIAPVVPNCPTVQTNWGSDYFARGGICQPGGQLSKSSRCPWLAEKLNITSSGEVLRRIRTTPWHPPGAGMATLALQV